MKIRRNADFGRHTKEKWSTRVRKSVSVDCGRRCQWKGERVEGEVDTMYSKDYLLRHSFIGVVTARPFCGAFCVPLVVRMLRAAYVMRCRSGSFWCVGWKVTKKGIQLPFYARLSAFLPKQSFFPRPFSRVNLILFIFVGRLIIETRWGTDLLSEGWYFIGAASWQMIWHRVLCFCFLMKWFEKCAFWVLEVRQRGRNWNFKIVKYRRLELYSLGKRFFLQSSSDISSVGKFVR